MLKQKLLATEELRLTLIQTIRVRYRCSFLPTLVAMQQTQTLKFLVNFQVNQAKEPTTVIEPLIDDPVQGVTPPKVVANLSVAGRRPASTVEELVDFMTGSEVEAIKEKKMASTSISCLNMKPPNPVEVAAKPYLCGSAVPKARR